MKKLFILDAVGYLFRSYYAIGPMTNDQGESTNALFGFIRSIQKVIKDFQPDYLVAIFDGPDNKKSRQEIYSDYKMHRKGAPEDLFPQFEWAFEYCEYAGIQAISVEGVEADDTMATLAIKAKNNGWESYLCTSDKDLYQLVGDHIKVINVHKENLLIDSAKVEELFGVPPHQMLDLLAIMGDKSDNIPGLPGFGPKTAASLLKEFGSLDTILQNPDKVPGKKKQETIKEFHQQAKLSQQLATLDLTVKTPENLEKFKIQPKNLDALNQFYRRMGFVSLLKDLQPITEKEKVSYQIIQSENDLIELIELLQKEREICVDTETTGVDPMQAKLVGIGLGTTPFEAWYIPFNQELSVSFLVEKLQALFSSPHLSFYGHNLKYDDHILKHYQMPIRNISFDTILASYILHPESRRHSLDTLSLELFHHQKIPIKSLIGEGKKQISMDAVALEKIAEYCCEDVDYTCRLKQLLEKKLKEEKLEEILFTIEIPLLPILAEMESHGIYLDKTKLSKMSKALHIQLEKLKSDIYDYVGKEFNLNSPKQLSEILYQHLGLKPPGRKKTEYSTGAAVLETLSEESPVVSKILQYRGLEKLRSTYVEALPQSVHPKTERIHCTFNQSVTATGRLSCQNPNLQNIPVRTEEGRKIREGFKPQKEGWSYLSADYSQIELRLLAHFSQDPMLIKAFQEGQDIHTYTASLIFEVPIEQVTKKMRYEAKTVNFGILYGQGAYGLSQELGISRKKAQEFIETYFARYPKISAYLESCKQLAQDTGYVYTMYGRRRNILEIHNKNPHIRAAALRLAINTPLQGTAADLIKKAMIQIDQSLKKQSLKGFMILQIHDELIFELPDHEIEKMTQIVQKDMESIADLRIPLTVDIAIGKNWGEC